MTDMTLLPVPAEVVRAVRDAATMTAAEHRHHAESRTFPADKLYHLIVAAALEADLPPVFKKGDRVEHEFGTGTVEAVYGDRAWLIQDRDGVPMTVRLKYLTLITGPQPGDPVTPETPVGTRVEYAGMRVEYAQSGGRRTLDSHMTQGWKCERLHCPAAHNYGGWVVAAPEDGES